LKQKLLQNIGPFIRGGGEDTTFETKAKDSEKVQGQGPSCRE